jgi:hypothetical protein
MARILAGCGGDGFGTKQHSCIPCTPIEQAASVVPHQKHALLWRSKRDEPELAPVW